MTSIVKLSVWYVASDLYKCERIRLQKTHTSADVLFWRLGWLVKTDPVDVIFTEKYQTDLDRQKSRHSGSVSITVQTQR